MKHKKVHKKKKKCIHVKVEQPNNEGDSVINLMFFLIRERVFFFVCTRDKRLQKTYQSIN